MEKFNNFRKESEIVQFEDLRHRDLSMEDIKTVPLETLFTTEFDTETKWPPLENLPDGFNPEWVLENGKNPGLGVHELHKQGIDGRDIVVAIIDQVLDTEHEEYKNSLINYSEYGKAKNEPISMHGPAVASLLVGKDCGTAPGAKLVFKAIPSGNNGDLFNPSKALEDIIKNNTILPEKDRVRIVSCSFGGRVGQYKTELGYDVWNSTVEKAKDAGIFMFGGGPFDYGGVGFGGCGSFEDKDDANTYSHRLYENDSDGKELIKAVREGNFEAVKEIYQSFDPAISNLADSEFKKYFQSLQLLHGKDKKSVFVPEDYRTFASSLHTKNQYCYSGRGGMSWTYPWLAGICALALQTNPHLTQEELSNIAYSTATINKNGLRIINPKGIVEAAKMKHT